MVAKGKKAGKKTPEGGRRREKEYGVVSWGDVDPATICRFVAFVEQHDGAVRFGRSRDRAMYSIGIYIGKERFTEWVRGGAEVDLYMAGLLDELAEDFGDA